MRSRVRFPEWTLFFCSTGTCHVSYHLCAHDRRFTFFLANYRAPFTTWRSFDFCKIIFFSWERGKVKTNKKDKMVVVVVLFYIYTPLKALTDLESTFKTCTSDHSITGRLLISTEGINGTIAATPTSIKTFQDFFTKLIPAAINMQWKRSETSETPFIDMKIKIAKEAQ